MMDQLPIKFGLFAHIIGCVLLASHVASAGCFLDLLWCSPADPVTKLNAYLVDNEPSDELYANIVAAKRLEASKSDQSQQCDARDESLLEVARNFIALEQINRDNMCNEGIEILDKLSASLRTHGKKPFKGPESRRRLNLLVIQQARKHFKACYETMDVAWDKLEQQHAKEEPPANLDHKLRFLVNLTNAIIFYRYFYEPSGHNNIHAKFLIGHTNKEISINAVRKSLVQLVKQETQINRLKEVNKKTGELVRTEKTVARYLNDYFWAPCETLVYGLDDKRRDLLDRTLKLIYAANLNVNHDLYAKYYFSNLLEWATNLSSCKRLLLRPSKELLAKQIHWSLNLGA